MEAWQAVIIAIIAAAPGIIALVAGARKNKADAYESLSGTIEKLGKRLDTVQADLEKTKSELGAWKDWATRLFDHAKKYTPRGVAIPAFQGEGKSEW